MEKTSSLIALEEEILNRHKTLQDKAERTFLNAEQHFVASVRIENRFSALKAHRY